MEDVIEFLVTLLSLFLSLLFVKGVESILDLVFSPALEIFDDLAPFVTRLLL